MDTIEDQLRRHPELSFMPVDDDDGDDPVILKVFKILTRLEVKINNNEKKLEAHMEAEEDKIHQLSKNMEVLSDNMAAMNHTLNNMLASVEKLNDKADWALSGFPENRKKPGQPDPEGHREYHEGLIYSREWWRDVIRDTIKKYVGLVLFGVIVGGGVLLWQAFVSEVHQTEVKMGLEKKADVKTNK